MSLYSNYLPKSRGAAALCDEELRRCAPSIFATQPIDTVSEKYSFVDAASFYANPNLAPARARVRGFTRLQFLRATMTDDEHLLHFESPRCPNTAIVAL
jgi:hypothetical protein